MSQTSVEMALTASQEAHCKAVVFTNNGDSNLPENALAPQRPPSRTSGMNEPGLGHNTTTPSTSGEVPVSPRKNKRSMAQTATVMASLCACVFLSALEVTIVTTALPTIASHFASDSGYTWIGTSYVLAHTASTPSWGKISDIWGRKPILLIANGIFFGGSLICALVDDFKAFIAGRAVQGLGAAGLQTMVNICIGDMFSQRDRGLYYGLTSMVWAVASGIGPVMGGAFTDQVSWRWCFWINLPITAVVFLLLVFTLKLPSPNTPVWAGLKAIDWPGSILIIGGTLMLLLGLYLGGVYEPWNSAPVVCLILFGILTGVLFILNEWKVAEYPVIPVHLFRAWSSAAAYAVCFFHAFVFMGVAYYLPLYFQAVLLASPLKSGLYLLPLILSITFTAALTGIYIQMTGKYLPAVYTGMVIMTLGIGLFSDIDLDSNWGKIITFQILTGIGVGMNFEGPLLAVQAVVSTQDVATATAAMSFIRTISTAISIVIGGVVFQNEIKGKKNLLVEGLGPDLARLFEGGSASANVDVIKTLTPEMQAVVKKAFFQSLKAIWIMASFSPATQADSC
ncbi:Fc.00g074730.m01.CDS01 [Cosmosporella sp. VM-42]